MGVDFSTPGKTLDVMGSEASSTVPGLPPRRGVRVDFDGDASRLQPVADVRDEVYGRVRELDDERGVAAGGFAGHRGDQSGSNGPGIAGS